MARRFYSSTAARTTLATGVDDSTTTLSVAAVSGWPTSFPYTLIVDQDTVNEEIVEVSARSGTTITVTRGVDGTVAVAHDAGAAVQHGVSARDFNEPNEFINGTGTVTETLLASGSVTEAKLGTGAVTSAKIFDGTIVNADINASAAIAQSKIEDLTSDLASKSDYALPVNAQTGTTYTFVLADAQKLTTASNAAAVTLTIPPQSSVAWGASSVIRVVNYGAGAVTVNGGSGVTVTNTATTLAQFESAAAIRTAEDAWTLVPFSGGVGNADFSNAATGTYTDGGISYKYVTFNASGTLTVTQEGFADILVCGSGGGGGWGQNSDNGGGGGGAGQHYYITDVYLPAGGHTVTIGGGGAGGSIARSLGLRGNRSRIGNFVRAIGGGGGGSFGSVNTLPHGGSGGGGNCTGTLTGGQAFEPDLGKNGGNGFNSATISRRSCGGGGGAGAVGQNSGDNVGGNGGNGLANAITGSSVTRCGGGAGISAGNSGSRTGGTGGGGNSPAGAGAANSGGGGGGNGSGNGGAGGSGVVIVRVKV